MAPFFAKKLSECGDATDSNCLWVAANNTMYFAMWLQDIIIVGATIYIATQVKGSGCICAQRQLARKPLQYNCKCTFTHVYVVGRWGCR